MQRQSHLGLPARLRSLKLWRKLAKEKRNDEEQSGAARASSGMFRDTHL